MKTFNFRTGQEGLALLAAMIALVAMAIASIALIRSVDTGVLVAGNLAFRENAINAGDAGIEQARSDLMAASALTTDKPADGYYATSQNALDITGNKTPASTSDNVDWDLDGKGTATPKCLAEDTAKFGKGTQVCYIVHRMCDGTGVLDASTCTTKAGTKGGSSLGAKRQMETFQQGSWSETTMFGYYRVTVRVKGPRNNIGFVQAFLII